MTGPEKRGRFVVWMALVGVAAFVVSVCVYAAFRPRQPMYHGVPLYEWVARYHSADTNYANWGSPQRKAEMETCAAAIRAIGTKALPFAMTDVNAYGPLWKYDQVRWVTYQIRRFLKLPDPVRLNRGMTMLKILGPIAEPCLPELAGNVSNGHLFSARLPLMDVGPAALPAFTNLLIHSRPPQTGGLVNALVSGIIDERIYPDEAAMAVPALIQIYRSRDNSDWPYAISGLGFVHERPELCVPLLAQGLSDTNAKIRIECAQALASFGDAASGHAHEVAALFNGSDAKSRGQICMALGDFPSAAEIAVPTLIQGLRDPAQDVRCVGGDLARQAR